MFTIGSFAGLAGVSAKVLRSYDGMGLFRPVWTDPSSGYRYYSPAQLPELRRIVALRDMGLGLAEIGHLVVGGADLRAALERRRAELERERREVERRLTSLEIQVQLGAAGSSQPDVVIRPIRSEAVATMTLADHEDDADAFHALESHVRDAGRRAHRPPGAIVRAGETPMEIFVPVTGPVPATDRIGYRRLPDCRAATIITRGPYDGVRAAREILERWVASAGLEPAGDLRILYLQFGAEPELRVPSGYVVDRAEDFVTELQLPVG